MSAWTTEELASVMRGHWRTRVRELGKMGSVVLAETTAVDLYAQRMAAATFVVSLYKRVQSYTYITCSTSAIVILKCIYLHQVVW